MNTSAALGGKRVAFGVGAVFFLIASFFSVSSFAGAQDGFFGSCPANSVNFGTEDEFFGVTDYNNHLLSSGPTSQTTDFALAAGTYEIGAVSTDGYETRATIDEQPNEQWFAEFLAADGTVLATSGITGDIPTGVERGFWTGSLGEVTLAADATSVRVVHAAIGSDSQNSVRAVCVGPLSEAEAEAIGDAATDPAADGAADGAAGGAAADGAAGGAAADGAAGDAAADGTAGDAAADGAGADGAAGDAAAQIDPSIASSISVNYDSTNIGPEVITLLCSDLGGINTFTEGLGSGIGEASAVDLVQDPVSAGSVCTVTFPNSATHECTMSVTPVGIDELTVVEGDGNKVITFPTQFEVDVFVDIFCTGDEIPTEVLAEVESAPVAQVTEAEPTFTG